MKKSVRILLCEDDPNLGTLLKEYLTAKGFEPSLARDGEEGLKLFRRESFDFLILDVMMPQMDGFTLAEEIT
jgi:DNA-binding response OmpR family regulator